MKRSNWVRLIAVILVISMLAAPVSAATNRGNEGVRANGMIGIIVEFIRDIIRDIFDDWFDEPGEEEPSPTPPVNPTTPTQPGETEPEETDPTEPGETKPGETKPTQPGETEPEETDPTEPGETEPEETDPTEPGETKPEETDPTEPAEDEEKPETTLQLIEGYKNTENGHLLRAQTYSLNQVIAQQNKKPMTTVTANRFGTKLGNGLGGNSISTGLKPMGGLSVMADDAEPTTIVSETPLVFDAANPVIPNGQYVIRYNDANHGSYMTNNTQTGSPWGTRVFLGTTVKEDATYFTFTRQEDGTYAIQGPAGNYINITRNAGSITGNANYFSVELKDGGIWLRDTDSNECINALGASTYSEKYFGGYSNGSNLELYAVTTIEPEEPEEPELPDPEMPDMGMVETIPFSKLTWEQVKNANSKYYADENCTNTVTVTAKSDDSGYDLIDADGKVLSTLEGSDLTQPIGVKLYIPGHIVYFPVTMYDYDQTTINNATDGKDTNGTTVREGMYFSNGGTELNQNQVQEADLSAYVDGKYYIQNFRAKDNGTASWLYHKTDATGTQKIRSTANQQDATVWTLTNKGNNQVTLSYVKDGTTYYMTVDDGTSDAVTTETLLTLETYSGTNMGIQIKGTEYLNQFGGKESTYFGGYETPNDDGNGMAFFPIAEDGTVSSTSLAVNYKIVSGYERWNWWHKATGNNANGDLFYTGLVENELVNDQIVFKVPEGGIFNGDTTVKNIYEFVDIPFVLNSDNGVYSFDSDVNGVYFEGAPQSGTEDKHHELHFALEEPQPMPHDISVGDGSTNAFLPYNNRWTPRDDGRGVYATDINYLFGMRADLDFSMTPNGRIKSTDDNSTPITFTFSGDDDVWIFIDGKLVADLGGIHNRLDVTFNFAENAVIYSEENSQDGNNTTGSYNDANFATTQQLFKINDGDDALIDMTREEFASTTEHVLQFFYLERGKGTSNCRIEFNLPMLDSIEITKEATKSWSAAYDDIDGDGDGTLPLSPEEQATVDATRFGFTLYKLAGPCLDENYNLLKDDIKADFEPIASTKFYVFRGDRMTGTRTTDAEGHFYLYNGETAKFITDIPVTGASYYVVEDQVPAGFLTPDYKYAGKSTYGYDYYGYTMGENDSSVLKNDHIDDASKLGEHELPLSATENNSYFITAKGSIEAPDTLEFICVNYVEHNDGTAEAFANEDVIVLDYGLPVDIDPMANDLIRGEGIRSIEIVHATTEKGFEYPCVTDENGEPVTDEDGEPVIDVAAVTELINDVDLSQGLTGHSGEYTFNDVDYVPAETDNSGNITTPAIRDTFTYTMKKQLTEVEVMSYLIKVTAVLEDITYEVYGEAKLYIAPATIMYYEENFSTVNLDSDVLKDLDDPNEKRLECLNDGMIVFESSLWDEGGWASNSAETLPEKVDNRQEMGVVAYPTNSTYGSDIHYMDDSGDSNGTSRYGNTDYKAIRFMYTFTGTGSTIFARCSDTTGYMQVKVYKGVSLDNADLITTYFRDTYWKDENDFNEGSGVEDSKNDILYNIPVYTTREINRTQNDDGTFGDAEVQDLDYGTYTVVCTVAKKGTPTDGNVLGAGADFYLDGIRVMQPLNIVTEKDENGEEIYPVVYEPLTAKALDAYNTDGEANLDVVTLREKLLTDVENGIEWDGENFVVMTDIDGALVSAEDYKGLGPKEEVYLTPGQTVRFSLKYTMPDGLRVYMGMKAPMGSAVVKVGSSTVTLENAPDCYRDITKSAEMKTLYDQVMNEEGHLLYTDPTGKEVYKTSEGYLYYADGSEMPGDIGELTPVYDMTQPYYVVTYTFTATRGIVSLTNIKVVGTYEFTIIDPDEGADITNPGTGSGENKNNEEVSA